MHIREVAADVETYHEDCSENCQGDTLVHQVVLCDPVDYEDGGQGSGQSCREGVEGSGALVLPTDTRTVTEVLGLSGGGTVGVTGEVDVGIDVAAGQIEEVTDSAVDLRRQEGYRQRWQIEEPRQKRSPDNTAQVLAD
jgi:hypothetical protein